MPRRRSKKLRPLRELKPGSLFRYPETGKTAVLDSHGVMGSRIRYIGAKRKVSFKVKRGKEVLKDVNFTAPAKVKIVSDASPVELLK